MVLEREFPPDERVEKEIQSLINSGYEVAICCFSFKKTAFLETNESYTIFRAHISSFVYKSSAACLIVPFYFWFWRNFLNRVYKHFKCDILHIHDLPLSKVGYQLKKKFKLKLVCDQHEYYSSWIVHTSHYNKGLGRIINWLSKWSSYEKKYLRKADLVFTVEEPLRKIYINDIGLSEGKVVTVPNTPDLSAYKNVGLPGEIAGEFKNRFILFYAGGLDSLRGIELVLDSINIIKHQVPEILFLVAGREQKGFSIQNKAEERGINEHLRFLGWLPRAMLPVYMSASHIGVFTPPLNRVEIHRTIATKIYQYCASGLPVIVSNAEMMKEFVEKNEVGFAIANATELSEKILKLYSDDKLYKTLRNNGQSIANKYSWDLTVGDMIKAYKQL